MAQKSSPKKGAKKAPAKKAPPAPPAAVKAPSKKPESTPARKPVAAKAAVTTSSKPIETKPVKKSAPAAPAAKAPEASTPPAKKEKIVPLSKQDLQYFRNLLLERRREIIGDVGSMESEAFKGGSNLSNMPIHMADVGTDNFEQEFTLGLIESERQVLREIQEALVRIDNGSFGICLGTGKQIPRVRLEAVPWAKYTIEYSRLLESGKLQQEEESSSESDSGDDDED